MRSATAEWARAISDVRTLVAQHGLTVAHTTLASAALSSDADGSNCLAMLVRRDGETSSALLKRLDKAIGTAWSDDEFADEVNG